MQEFLLATCRPFVGFLAGTTGDADCTCIPVAGVTVMTLILIVSLFAFQRKIDFAIADVCVCVLKVGSACHFSGEDRNASITINVTKPQVPIQ